MSNLFLGKVGNETPVLRRVRGADALILLGNIGVPTSPLTYLAFRAWSSEWPRIVWIPGRLEQGDNYEKGIELCKRCVSGLGRVTVLNGVESRYIKMKGIEILGIPSAPTDAIAEEDSRMLKEDIEQVKESDSVIICSGDSPSQFYEDTVSCVMEKRCVKGWLSCGPTVCSGMLSKNLFWSQNPQRQKEEGSLNKYWRADSILNVPSYR